MIKTPYLQSESGWLGEIVVYKPTGQVGAVEGVTESLAGWETELKVVSKHGAVRRAPPADFQEAEGEQRAAFFENP
jgi:hypothetical protein